MPSATHSDVLWTKIRLAEGRLTAASDRFWNHPDLGHLFPEFLIQLHHIIKGGLGLMAFAASQATERRHDPVAMLAAEYLVHHIEEEKDHADWLLDDIATLGIQRSVVTHEAPLESVVSLIGGQHFWIANAHPVTVFGYLLVFEGSPPLVEELELIERRTGLPSSAFRCLRSHAEDDPAHLADLNRTLDRMPLAPAHSQRLALSAFHAIDAAASLFDEILARSRTAPEVDDQSRVLLHHA